MVCPAAGATACTTPAGLTGDLGATGAAGRAINASPGPGRKGGGVTATAAFPRTRAPARVAANGVCPGSSMAAAAVGCGLTTVALAEPEALTAAFPKAPPGTPDMTVCRVTAVMPAAWTPPSQARTQREPIRTRVFAALCGCILLWCPEKRCAASPKCWLRSGVPFARQSSI